MNSGSRIWLLRLLSQNSQGLMKPSSIQKASNIVFPHKYQYQAIILHLIEPASMESLPFNPSIWTIEPLTSSSTEVRFLNRSHRLRAFLFLSRYLSLPRNTRRSGISQRAYSGKRLQLSLFSVYSTISHPDTLIPVIFYSRPKLYSSFTVSL